LTSPNPAPNGYLTSGLPADTVDAARDDLLNLFEDKSTPLKDNTAYYEAERRPDAIGIAVPQAMRKLLAHVGYPRLYIDSMAERQELEGFRLGGADKADDELWDWWQANDLDVEATLGHTDAFIHGRSYITVAQPDPDVDPGVDPEVPIIRVEPPTNLYAAIDPRTRKVTQAIRPIYDADGNSVIQATLYLPTQTVIWNKEQGQWVLLKVIPHNLEMVPVIPIANRTKLSDLYGSSSITPELRSVTDAAGRILMDMQGTAELMAVPQRLLFGVTPQELGVDAVTGLASFDAYMARILAFSDPDGKAQQFLAAELRNFVDALDALDKKAAAYTGLPPQYLSAQSDNPASAEAIKASESRLVKMVERKNKIFGGSWEQAMRVAYKVMKGGDVPPQYYRMESIWRDPSTPTYAAKADAASKLYANGMGLIPKERGRIDLGYSVSERAEMAKWDEQENPLGALGQIMSPPQGNSANPAKVNGQAASAADPSSPVTK
jgi:hypothetical protein